MTNCNNPIIQELGPSGPWLVDSLDGYGGGGDVADAVSTSPWRALQRCEARKGISNGKCRYRNPLPACETGVDEADHAELVRCGFGSHILYEIGECENGLTVDEIEKIHERIRREIYLHYLSKTCPCGAPQPDMWERTCWTCGVADRLTGERTCGIGGMGDRLSTRVNAIRRKAMTN